MDHVYGVLQDVYAVLVALFFGAVGIWVTKTQGWSIWRQAAVAAFLVAVVILFIALVGALL